MHLWPKEKKKNFARRAGKSLRQLGLSSSNDCWEENGKRNYKEVIETARIFGIHSEERKLGKSDIHRAY